jgi:excisionase family DNA binding protein
MSQKLNGIAETAKEWGVSKDTVRRQIKIGAIHAVKVGRRTLIPQSEIDRVCTHGTTAKGK